jgi:hypothetical protein
MPFQCVLTIDDKTFSVLSFSYKMQRDSDRSGRPTSSLYGCKILLTVEHSPNCILLHDWAYKNHEVKNGSITFMKRDNFQKQTEIKFSEGYIMAISTEFLNEGDMPMIESIVITANKFEYESQGNMTSYELDWPS